MIYSMTGYGKATRQYESKTMTLEIRSLNSKQIDIGLRMPQAYKDREIELRNEIVRRLQRGKVDVVITVEDASASASVSVNSQVVKKYLEQIRSIAGEYHFPFSEVLLAAALRMPEALKAEAPVVAEEEWKVVLDCLDEALRQVEAFRLQEGQAMEKDFQMRIELIEKYLDEIRPFEEQRIIRIKERLQRTLTEVMGNEGYDKNRFEQELIYYLEKLDITEEKVRLKNHCEYFYKTMKEEYPGRKLGFIAQEMGREINTIGSKANDSQIQKLVVMMKDELEKVKEQLLNVL